MHTILPLCVLATGLLACVDPSQSDEVTIDGSAEDGRSDSLAGKRVRYSFSEQPRILTYETLPGEVTVAKEGNVLHVSGPLSLFTDSLKATLELTATNDSLSSWATGRRLGLMLFHTKEFLVFGTGLPESEWQPVRCAANAGAAQIFSDTVRIDHGRQQLLVFKDGAISQTFSFASCGITDDADPATALVMGAFVLPVERIFDLGGSHPFELTLSKLQQ